ncbi:DUF6214 family protein [Streptomyces sp. SP2-10]|nr:DUF6214 family protein [Streptomyces sp. SP2-10]
MSVWPAWEVREHGGATAWFHVRLAFPDGAGVDALAVLSGGRLSIEDVRAQPALSLADLTVLADWIEGPLSEACGVAPEKNPAGGTGTGTGTEGEARVERGGHAADAAGAEPGAGCPAMFAGTEAGAGCPAMAVGADPGAGCPAVADGVEWGAGRVAVAGGAEPGGGRLAPAGVTGPVPGHVAEAGRVAEAGGDGSEAGCAGSRRARRAWPRGVEGRRLVAEQYRAARDEGADPVLAVMDATGHSRRRSLRLIAQARDAGLLAPRHARR